MKSFSIPAHLIRQYIFCPRIVYFNEVRQLKPKQTLWMSQGVDFHQRTEMLNRRRKLTKYGVVETAKFTHNVHLKSEELLIHGVVDAIIDAGEAYFPVEFKLAESPPSLGHILQLTAYGVMMEECYKVSIERGFLLYGAKGKVVQVEIQRYRDRLTAILGKIHKLYENSLMPSSSATENKCGQCEYYNYCADR